MMIYWKDFDYSSLNVEDYSIKKIKDDQGKVIEEIKYSNIIFSFDLESTSLIKTPEGEYKIFDKSMTKEYLKKCTKHGLVYLWMVGINDTVIYGRDFQEYADFEYKMLYLFKDVRRIYYIHNLSFDFHWIQSVLGTDWNVFTRKSRKIMSAESEYLGITYKCSYVLTNRSLDNVAKDYKLPVLKKTGTIEYNVMRSPLTQLTQEEMDYAESDILVIYHLIKAHIDVYKSLLLIPLTSTGKIRRKVRSLYNRNLDHLKKVTKLLPTTFEEFNLLTTAYMGGYVHSNYKHTNKILNTVYSYDITSSYPWEIVSKKYPMTAFSERLDNDLSKIDFENEAYIVDITLYDIEAKSGMSFLSLSKMNKEVLPSKLKVDNGRVLEADRIRYTLTDVDLNIVMASYKVKGYKINHLYTAKKDYLEASFIKLVLQLYKDKTVLKGIEEQASRYNTAKEYINALYGMMVMKILNDEILYNHCKWDVNKLTKQMAEEILSKKAEKEEEYISFSWGVWVAAYARGHLWRMILNDPDNVVYCDTDSVKSLVEFDKYIEKDRLRILKEISDVCKARDLNPEDFMPYTQDGKMKMIGVFDKERTYKQFITLGAKKYAYTYEDNGVTITLAGVNKKTGSMALKNIEDFYDGRFFDYDEAGKNEVSYIDNQEPFILPDGYRVNCRYAICLLPTTYTLSMTPDYEELVDSTSNIAGSHLFM